MQFANTILVKNSNLTLIFYTERFFTKPNCREVPFFLENANKIDFCAKWWQVFGHQGHDFASMTFCEGQNCAKTTLELWNIEVNIRLLLATVNVFLLALKNVKYSQVEFDMCSISHPSLKTGLKDLFQIQLWLFGQLKKHWFYEGQEISEANYLVLIMNKKTFWAVLVF